MFLLTTLICYLLNRSNKPHMKYIVTRDCVCECSVHEVRNYPRPGITIRKLLKDEIVNEVEIFTNHFGIFIRVKKDEDENVFYDIKPENLKRIP